MKVIAVLLQTLQTNDRLYDYKCLCSYASCREEL